MGNMMLEAFTLGSQAVQRCSNCEDDFITSEIDATFFSYNKPDGASQQRTTFLELFEEGFSTTSGSTLHEELDHHNLDVVYSRLPSLQVEEYRLETSSRKQLMGCNLPSVSNPAISTNSVKLDYHEEELLLCKNNLFMQSAVRINSIPRDHDGITNLTYSSQKAARVGGDFEDEVAGAATIDGTAGLEYSSSSNATLKGSPTSRPNISVAAASSSLIISSSSTALLNANNATAASAGVPASAASCCEGGGGGGEMELLNDNYGAVSNIVRDDDQVVQNLRWPSTSAAGARASKRRKRSRARKNSEEMEHQRRTHIAVERNRRKQMNEHLSALRSLMPASYIQRGDQASIVGGAIQFVRELEQVLHSLQVQKQLQAAAAGHDYSNLNGAPAGMSEIESSTVGMQQEELMMQQERAVCKYRPLASTATELPELGVGATSCCLLLPNSYNSYLAAASLDQAGEHGEAEVLYAESKSPTATVEVKMMGSSFAQVKVLAQKRPRLLLHALATMGDLHLLVLHLNITTIDHTVLYSFNLEMGTECQLQLANDLADSMQQIFGAFEVMQELQLKEPCHQ